MLNFIYGRAATGKSYRIIEDICKDVNEGRNVVLLVPEQFTFESERALLKSLGKRSTTDVSVLSFTRLYDEITRRVGGRVANNITDANKVILMHRAFKSVKDQLKIWNKYVGSAKFTTNLISAINEFKSSAIEPEQIETAAQNINNSYLKLKLHDIAIIYAAYNALLSDAFLDPCDDLTRLNEKLLTYKYFENKNVYIDSFKNFTGQQYKILERIISQAENVCVAVTSNDIASSDISLFANVNKTVAKISAIANKYGTEIGKPIKLNNQFYKNNSLNKIEAFLSGSKLAFDNEKISGVSICKCENMADEAAFTARTIRKLVRENGYRYKDFVIICRNAEQYQKLIEKQCRKNNVFCFADKRKGIEKQALTVLINSALKLVNNLTTDEILNFHKTGLTEISLNEISELENYTFLWNVKGNIWATDWTMNPSGFIAENEDKSKSEKNIAKLEFLNQIRQKAISPILKFKEMFKGTPRQMASAIIKLLENCKTSEKLRDNYNKCRLASLSEEADISRQCWDTVMELLDGIVKCLPEKEISAAEFADLWKTSLSFATIGNIPQMLDEVTFGSADRIKPSRPKVAFVLGLNQGVFPANNSAFGVFAESEREILIGNGLEIPSFGITAAIDEDYLLYSSVCCPTEKLFLTYAVNDAGGAILEPSNIIGEIRDKFKNLNFITEEESDLSFDNLPETFACANDKMYSLYSTNKAAYLTINSALSDISSNLLEEKLNNFSKDNSKISAQNALKLFGSNINVSATAFDTFHRCKFSYFCRYGLKLKKLQPAEFDVLQRGTLSHYVLENLISRYFTDFENLTRNKCDELIDKLVSEYLSLIDGYERIETPRIKFLVNIISASLKDVSYHIVEELLQSDFVPKYCEMKIGAGGVVPTKQIDFAAGEMRIQGNIDRVDTWNGYVRIVDYKTGTKIFKLPDILVGLNMQMLIYLYTIVRGDNSELNKYLPAGILYMPSKRDFGDPKVLSMNGLVLLEEDVITAMDKQGEGIYIPRKPFKADGSLKKQITSFADSFMFEEIFNYIELLLKKMGTTVLEGDLSAVPTDGIDSNACKYCDFSAICCIEDNEHLTSDKTLTNADILEKLKEANQNGI